MEHNVDSVVDDLLSQLKVSSKYNKGNRKNEFKLDKENLEEFLLDYSGKLIKDSVEYVEDVKQFITSAPDAKDVEALSKLVGASAAAIETLNKILIAKENNKNRTKIKKLDIQSKKELQQDTNTTLGLTINREELLKQIINDAKVIEIDETS